MLNTQIHSQHVLLYNVQRVRHYDNTFSDIIITDITFMLMAIT